MYLHCEKADNPTTVIENRNGSAGIFDELYSKLQRLVRIHEIMHDQRELGFVDGFAFAFAFAVKLLPHGCTDGNASHRFMCTAASTWRAF